MTTSTNQSNNTGNPALSASGANAPCTRRPLISTASKVPHKPISWLLEPYIAKGKITILMGDPEAGKTTFALYVAAIASNGGAILDARGGGCLAGDVLYMSAEDGLEDTMRPRLDAAGANLSRVHFITGWADGHKSGMVTLQDLDVLEQAMATYHPMLMVVDPLQAYIGGGVDIYRANEVRSVLAGLADLASKHACAVLLITHLTKGTGGNVLYRGIGSIDITAVARSVLWAGMAHDEWDPELRGIIQTKNSLAKKGEPIGYKIVGGKILEAESSRIDPRLMLNPYHYQPNQSRGGGTKRATSQGFTSASRVPGSSARPVHPQSVPSPSGASTVGNPPASSPALTGTTAPAPAMQIPSCFLDYDDGADREDAGAAHFEPPYLNEDDEPAEDRHCQTPSQIIIDPSCIDYAQRKGLRGDEQQKSA